MPDQVVITLPMLSYESWKIILENKLTVEIWDSQKRKLYKTKWDGNTVADEIKLWFDFPDNLVVVSKETVEASG